jgi:hypothetical protein
MHATAAETIEMRSCAVLFAGLAWLGAAGPGVIRAQQSEPADSDRPKITFRAQPNIGTTPARIVLTAELVGGANDFREYYCPTIEWDWGDDTRSESTSDCEPYEAGRSEIRRRFAVEHVFRRPGQFRLFLRLKQRDKVVGSSSVTVTIRSRGTE